MTGLVSVTFRDKSPEEIVLETKSAGLDAIEWGGDVHVPHGNARIASRVKKLCDDNNIGIPEYGSYYVLGQSERDLYKKALDSCIALGCDTVRVWALMGKGNDEVPSSLYGKCVEDAKYICDENKDITVCMECHPQSLTDEYHCAMRFIKDVDRKNLKMFWQPNQFKPFEYNIDAARALKPYVKSIHTFSWKREERFPLGILENEWREYIAILGKDKNYMLEFMHDGKTETLKDTAGTLKKWLQK